MDKKRAIERGKRTVRLFFRIRRGYKIYLAFATGILSALALYGELYHFCESRFYACALAVLAGAFITAVMLLIMEVIRFFVTNAKKLGMKLLTRYRERRKSDDGKEEA